MRTFSEIVLEIIRLKGYKSEAQVADLLNLKPSSLSSCKARNSYPFDELFAFCEEENVPLDHLFIEGRAEEFVILKDERAIITEYRKLHPEDKDRISDLITHYRVTPKPKLS